MNTGAFPKMHVSLYVQDLEKTRTFYDQFFGQEPVKQKSKYLKYVLEEPALIISFVEKPENVQALFGHLGFQVGTREEMMEKLSVARKQGILSKEEMGVSCCYAVQDKFWATDPDGFRWEVYYFHKDVEFNDPHYDLEEKTDFISLNDEIAPCC